MTGITAAIVGVVLNLAIDFGVAVTIPGGFDHGIDRFLTLLTVLSFVALFFGSRSMYFESCLPAFRINQQDMKRYLPEYENASLSKPSFTAFTISL